MTRGPSLLAGLSLLASVGCAGFSSEEVPPEGADAGAPDGQPSADGSTEDASRPAARVRCVSTICAAPLTCCAPFDERLSPSCVESGNVCPARHGELRCSDPTACGAGEVCCSSGRRGPGQLTFEIASAYCVSASACPDAELQHRLCALGEAAHCPGQACKPYTRDINQQGQNLPVQPEGYGTCQ